MPSPFPGMDPYLENPDIFPDFHDSVITYLREAIQASLPPPYFAALGRRVWIEVSRRTVGPDVQIQAQDLACLHLVPKSPALRPLRTCRWRVPSRSRLPMTNFVNRLSRYSFGVTKANDS